jgi:hypothetical protein
VHEDDDQHRFSTMPSFIRISSRSEGSAFEKLPVLIETSPENHGMVQSSMDLV